MIGVFDSGFGGLHVLRGIAKELPEYGYVYAGDSARAPYGPKSVEEVYEFTKQGVEFLFAPRFTSSLCTWVPSADSDREDLRTARVWGFP